MPVKGEDVGDTKTFHYNKTNGIGGGEIFIGVLKYNLSGPLLIVGINPDDCGAALENLPEKVRSADIAQARKEESVSLRNYEVSGKGATASFCNPVPYLLGFTVVSVMSAN